MKLQIYGGMSQVPTSNIRVGFLDSGSEILRFHSLIKIKIIIFYLIYILIYFRNCLKKKKSFAFVLKSAPLFMFLCASINTIMKYMFGC